jgi:hypothetical protein
MDFGGDVHRIRAEDYFGIPQGLKPKVDFVALTEPLKSCPVKEALV